MARAVRGRIEGSKIGQPHVFKWLKSPNPEEMPPAEMVIAISEALDWRLTPHDLRPDLYPNPADALPDGHASRCPCACMERRA